LKIAAKPEPFGVPEEGGPEEVLFIVEMPKERVLAYAGNSSDLARTGAVVSLACEQLGCR
jgi:hypothetical protein